jgi:F0F1-type ATP synthase membrane subunit b/b'
MSNHTPEGGKQYPISPDHQKDTTSNANAGDPKAAARDAADRTRAEAARTGEQLKHQGEEIASAAKAKATGFAREQKEAGAAGIDSVARAVDKAADELEETSPELARHARDAASQVHNFSERLREKSIGGIVDDLTGYAKREPAAFFGVAVVAGFALSRFLGARTERGHDSGSTRYRSEMDRGASAGSNIGAPSSMSNQNRNDYTAGRL